MSDQYVLASVVLSIAILFAFFGSNNYSYLANDSINISCIKTNYAITYVVQLNNISDGSYYYLNGSIGAPSLYDGKITQDTIQSNKIQSVIDSNGATYIRINNGMWQ